MSDRDSRRPDSTIAQFYMGAVKDEFSSEKEGRPIYLSVPFIRMMIPGDGKFTQTDWVKFRNKEAEERGEDVKGYVKRFPREWNAFRNSQSQSSSGTPLEAWPNPALNAARVAELKSLNIHTLEDLISVADGNLANLGMGARELQNQARAFKAAAQDAAFINKVTADNERLSSEVAELRKKLEELSSEENSQEVSIKKRGRPRKVLNGEPLQN